jgi:hypothetical protein
MFPCVKEHQTGHPLSPPSGNFMPEIILLRFHAARLRSRLIWRHANQNGIIRILTGINRDKPALSGMNKK